MSQRAANIAVVETAEEALKLWCLWQPEEDEEAQAGVGEVVGQGSGEGVRGNFKRGRDNERRGGNAITAGGKWRGGGIGVGGR